MYYRILVKARQYLYLYAGAGAIHAVDAEKSVRVVGIRAKDL